MRDVVVLADDNAQESDSKLAHRRIRVALRVCEVARGALEHHRAEHGC